MIFGVGVLWFLGCRCILVCAYTCVEFDFRFCVIFVLRFGLRCGYVLNLGFVDRLLTFRVAVNCCFG